MSSLKQSFRKKGFFYCFLLGTLLSFLFLISYFLIPPLISSNYYQKSLSLLRKKSLAIQKEFSALMADLQEKQKAISSFPFPRKRDEIFALFKNISLAKEKEGIGYYDSSGSLTLWLGNVTDLEPLFSSTEGEVLNREPESSFLVRYKASVYLVLRQKVNGEDHVVFYRLLAFLPQFQTPYLQEYHFLRPGLQRNCDINYWDFREDVSGFEKIFSRYKDEYIGQPRLQNEIQTMFFPLRNEKKIIIATVTLSSPSLSSSISTKKENLILIFYFLIGISIIFLIFHFAQTALFSKEKNPLSLFLLVAALICLRLIFFPISNLEKIRSVPVFSPSQASFFSFWNLTKSPADIFLTSLCLFFVISCLAIYFKNLFEIKKAHPSLLFSLAAKIVLIIASLFLVFAFQNILCSLILNSNINLLRFSFNLSFFLLHFSVLLLSLSLFLLLFAALRTVAAFSSNFLLPFFILIFGLGVSFFLIKERYPFPFFLLQIAMIISIFLLSFFPRALKRKDILFACFLLGTFFISISLGHYTWNRNRSLIQGFLKNIILSQEDWGNFLIEQSFPEIEKKRKAIVSFLHTSKPFDLARSLLEETLIAKFNWYSSLEIVNPEGDILSSFSLNIPKLFRPEFRLPLSQNWVKSRLIIPFMGKEKDFIVAYKDWFENENYLGRTTLCLSVDYELLPFLYSANPYYELLRVSSIPSLNQIDFGFAIFDLKGQLIFNPSKISSGIPPILLQKIRPFQTSLWSTFSDRKNTYTSFFFQAKNRIYSLFLPQKKFIHFSLEFLKLLFFYLLLLFLVGLSVLALGKRRFRQFFWSFSNRVYASFMAIALIPLLLFTFFTRSFFSRIFTQQFIEKAEVHANFARSLMEDFIFLQQEEKATTLSLSEDLVLWISSTIANDVNLYKEGRLASSSRREFFDSGLLPELIDGEIYYKIQFENNPFYTQRQKIGTYSFYTLTIPYSLQDSLLLISLPFPFERQEISKTTEDLIEFLFFISVFFIALVLIFARGIGATIITPIKKLLAGTREVSLGNLEISIEHKSRDEMKTLVDGFNAMIKNLKRHEQELAEMSKKAAWAEMARKVAHEIKNPLTPIQLSAEHILQVYEDRKGNLEKALKESASYIISEVENLRKIAQEFLEISKESGLQRELFDLREIIEETISPYKKMLSQRIKFKERYEGEGFAFEGDRSKIRIALRNIIINAIEAIRGKGEIGIKLIREKENFELEIKDTGTGMEKDMLEKIFEPYFSTKDVGTGLGLPIAKKIIEDHGGSIQVSSELKKGTTVAITFPVNSK